MSRALGVLTETPAYASCGRPCILDPDNDISFSSTLTIGILAQLVISSRSEWKNFPASSLQDLY